LNKSGRNQQKKEKKEMKRKREKRKKKVETRSRTVSAKYLRQSGSECLSHKINNSLK
jgi:hypothetical protein